MDKSITFGRDVSNDVVLTQNAISAQHAKLEHRDSGWFLTDLSSNGTYVNGKRIPKHFKFPVTRKDDITFAKVAPLDWKDIESFRSAAWFRQPLPALVAVVLVLVLGSFTVYGFRYPDRLPFGNATGSAGLGAAVADPPSADTGASTDTVVPAQSPDPVPASAGFEAIAQQYEKAVVLIQHSFWYTVTLPSGEVVYLSRKNDRFEVSRSRAGLTAISITGTGFLVGNQGKVVTNRHVAVPWYDSNEVLSELEGTSALQSLRTMAGSGSYVPQISGQSKQLGIALNMEAYHGSSSVTACATIRYAREEALDLAVMQTHHGRAPAQATTIPRSAILRPGDAVTKAAEAAILGFPNGFDTAITGRVIEATFNKGTVSQVSDPDRIQYDISSGPGASGSPVFDREGKIIAVNYAGLHWFPGMINYGIKAEHIHHLLD